MLFTATQPALDARHLPTGHPAGLDLAGRELAPEAIRRFFQETIWRLGEDRLDRHGVMTSFRLCGAEVDFARRRVGDLFRFVVSDLVPIVVPTSAAAASREDALERNHALRHPAEGLRPARLFHAARDEG